MKTMTLDYAGNLRRFIAFFSSLNASTYIDGKNSGKGYTSTNDNSEGASENRHNQLQNDRRVFTGNYFAGPHCIFDPRLLSQK